MNNQIAPISKEAKQYLVTIHNLASNNKTMQVQHEHRSLYNELRRNAFVIPSRSSSTNHIIPEITSIGIVYAEQLIEQNRTKWHRRISYSFNLLTIIIALLSLIKTA